MLRMRLLKRTAGFTLVELMCTVGIIGLLAGIVVPTFVDARTRSRTTVCINNLRLIEAGKEQWSLFTNAPDFAITTDLDVIPYLRGNVMPVCPAGGTYNTQAVGTPATCSVGGTHTL